MKKISIFIISLFLILQLYSNVFCYAISNIGKINFEAIISENHTPASNMQVNIYKIGVKKDLENFIFSNGFEKSNLNIDNFTEQNIKNIQEYAEKHTSPEYIRNTDNNGKFILSNLEPGLYLFVQASYKDEYTMQTMLVQIPQIENGSINYEFTAKPKISISSRINEEIKNVPEIKDNVLPQTGTLEWLVPLFTIVGFILFSIGWLKFYIDFKKKLN